MFNSQNPCGLREHTLRFRWCGAIPDLQLFDGLSSFADDEADFVGRDEDLLDGTAVHVTVKARTVPTLLHDLAQQPLGLTVGGGGARITSQRLHPTKTKQKLHLTFLSLSIVKEALR